MGNFFNVMQRLCRAASFGGALAAVLFALPMRGQEYRTSNPNIVVAAYLHRFPAYVEWPATASATNLPPWRIAILGNDPFGEALVSICKTNPVKGRQFEIIHATNVQDLPSCDVVYLASKDTDELSAQLSALTGRPVLTVGVAPDFLKLGGIILVEAERSPKFSVNLDEARANGLKINVKMLELATHIIENGRRKK